MASFISVECKGELVWSFIISNPIPVDRSSRFQFIAPVFFNSQTDQKVQRSLYSYSNIQVHADVYHTALA